jgi:hypothetical protein
MTNVHPDRDSFEPTRRTRPVSDWADEAFRGADPFDPSQVSANPYQRQQRSTELYNPHLGMAIFAAVMFLPVGIFAIYMSGQVGRKRAMGDSVGAIEASNRTRLLGLIGIGAGIATLVILMFVGCSALWTAYQYGY